MSGEQHPADARRRAEEALVFMDAALLNEMPPLPTQVKALADSVRALLNASALAAGEREERPKMPPNRIVHYGFFGITERDAPNECVVCSEAYGPCPDCDRKRANGKRQEACLHYEHGDGDCLDNACGVCTERYRAFVDSIHPKRRAVQPPHPAPEDDDCDVPGVCTRCAPLVNEEIGRWQRRIEQVITEASIVPIDASGNESGDTLDYSADQITAALAEAMGATAPPRPAPDAVAEAAERLREAFPNYTAMSADCDCPTCLTMRLLSALDARRRG